MQFAPIFPVCKKIRTLCAHDFWPCPHLKAPLPPPFAPPPGKKLITPLGVHMVGKSISFISGKKKKIRDLFHIVGNHFTFTHENPAHMARKPTTCDETLKMVRHREYWILIGGRGSLPLLDPTSFFWPLIALHGLANSRLPTYAPRSPRFRFSNTAVNELIQKFPD